MDTPIAFLYEDADVVVVNKPPGVTVIPAAGHPSASCLRDKVAAALGTPAWVVHRVDRDTSGCVVLARSAAAHRALLLAFEGSAVGRTYSAFLAGVPATVAGVINTPLHTARRGKMRPAEPGEPGTLDAVTDFACPAAWRVEGRLIAAAVASPLTGRHHQIRVHMRSIGAPILGDTLYGGTLAAPGAGWPLSRLALHAASVQFEHPVSGRTIDVTAPNPPDVEVFADWLRQHGIAGGLA